MKWLRRLLCRVRGHRWNLDPITFYKPDGIWLARSCQRCGRLTMQMLSSRTPRPWPHPGMVDTSADQFVVFTAHPVDNTDPEPWKVPDHGKN